MAIRIDFGNIIPISDNLAKIRLKTIDNKTFTLTFMTEEDIKNMPPKVTVSKVVSLKRLRRML